MFPVLADIVFTASATWEARLVSNGNQTWNQVLKADFSLWNHALNHFPQKLRKPSLFLLFQIQDWIYPLPECQILGVWA